MAQDWLKISASHPTYQLPSEQEELSWHVGGPATQELLRLQYPSAWA